MTTSEASSPSVHLNGTQSVSSTKAPKFGMMIPNRIFVGGITGNTTEAELRQFFTTFGAIKDCKIITDRAGVSKGYGFVTFVQLEDAEKLMQKEGEHLIFKDRKLNIGPAVRKQQAQTVAALPQYPSLYETAAPGTVVYANGLPCVLQNGLAMYHVPDGYGLSGPSPMQVAQPYPYILPQQLNVAQSGYYQTPTAATAAALQLAAPASAWQFASQGMGIQAAMAASGSHMQASAGGSAPVMDQYIYQMPQVFSNPEMVSHPTGLHYQRLDVSQLPVIDQISNEGSLITEPSIASGHLQYVDVQRMAAASAFSANSASAAAAALSPASKDNSNILLTGSIQKTPTQNYGVKRVLSVPQEIIHSGSSPYNVYGLPPVKIFAGQDRQRIVARTVVGNSDIQIIPKSQS